MVLKMMALGAVALAGACGDDATADDDRIRVVAGFYPLAEMSQEIGADRFEVTGLTPGGGEPHDLELSPDQVDAIEDADVLVVLGANFQPAVDEAAARRDGLTVEILRALPVAAEDDPHVWLDPALWSDAAAPIAEALSKVDPDGASIYATNAERYVDRLTALDEEFRAGLATCERRTIVTAHDAFGWFSDRYDLATLPIAGIEPNEEPSADRIAELADLVESQGITTIFTETLVSPDVAETLAREASGLHTTVLNPIEGLTDEERDRGENYVTLMRENLKQLQGALECGD
ncbi:MAG: metal ABC transporter substrate-binding protein [Actinomycetota bacterium]